MEIIKWDESYGVKIKTIDDQHKKLIDMINEFYENVNTLSNKDSVSVLLKKMKGYSIMHFNSEEAYLKKYKFPGLEEHKEEHKRFINKINEIESRINEGKFLISVEVTNFLKDWLKNHILVSDKKYSNFLIEKGVK